MTHRPAPRLSVFIATSLDGYIADLDDRLDWLEGAAWPGEDYGFDDFIDTVDALAMGRGTYDHIAHLEPLPFEGRPVFVFTNHPPALRDGVTFWAVSPHDAVAHWSSLGLQRVYIDGGRLISSFLAEGLIDDLTISTPPLLLGAGRPLFHPGFPTTALHLEHTRTWPSGWAARTYTRANAHHSTEAAE